MILSFLKERAFYLALLIFLPTVVNVTQLFYILATLGGFIYSLKAIKDGRINSLAAILLLIGVISSLTFYVGFSEVKEGVSKSLNEFLPYGFFLFCTYYFSASLDDKVLKYLLGFILFEVVVGVFEYVTGARYIIAPQATGEADFGYNDLAYYSRVFGISKTTSIFALKVFLGLLMLYYLNLKHRYRNICMVILFVGLYITFNRSAIFSSAFFCTLLFFSKDKYWKRISFWGMGIAIVLGGIYASEIIFQFNRGNNSLDLSGRDLVYANFWKFIRENLLLGNFSHKRWVMINDGIYHAHNSFVQTLANNGILIASLYFLFIIRSINRRSYIYILPICLYSIGQYGIFWGTSFMDIIFLFFIVKCNEIVQYENNLNRRSTSELYENSTYYRCY